MILLDTNVLMYAHGAPHAHKADCIALLRQAAEGAVSVAIDAEALQEILYRYRAIRRWEQGRRAYDLVRVAIPTVLPIDAETMDLARALMDREPTLIARDAVHAAVVLGRPEVDALCSYDSDFDCLDGLVRIEPAALLS